MRSPFGLSHWSCILFALLLLSPLVQARDFRLWGAVLLGRNGTAPQDLPKALVPYQKRLGDVFGYDSFEILGKSSHEISDDTEQWLIPGKTFSVRSVVQPTSDSNFRVELQLYQGKKELVQTVAKLGPRSPLFIRGPLYGNGQLIIVIMVRDDD
ncbi:MAG: hypothetical protein ABIT76_09295 [Chthoniobacterales bacterium]